MNLVRWLRKNNKKIMAIVVIIILFGFIGGSQLLRLLAQRQIRSVATYDRNQTITDQDIRTARNELELLQNLKSRSFLQSQDLHGLLLSEILFSERSAHPAVINYLKQTIQSQRLRVSQAQLSDLYQGSSVAAVYWILLKYEAHRAGITVSNNDCGMVLSQVAKQLFKGISYQQLIQNTMNRYGMSEDAVLTVFGDLISIVQYSRIVCDMEDITSSQLKHMVSCEQESVKADYVKMDAQTFLKLIDTNSMPADDVLVTQFNHYKDDRPGQATQDNPFGFGYRLPDRVQMEYILLKLDEVQKTIEAPTQDALENFYQTNAQSMFTEQVPTDPNDPNSPKKDVTKSYPQVAAEVRQQLIAQQTIAKAQDILQDARNATRLPLSEEQTSGMSLDAIKAKAVSYGTAAEELHKQYELPVYSGKTGLLSRADVRAGRYLSRMYISGRGDARIPISEYAFSVPPLKVDDPVLLNVQKPRLYSNIGPVRDRMTGSSASVTGQVMALLRVVVVEPSAAPEALEYSYDNSPIDLTGSEAPDMVSIKDQVIADVREHQAYEMMLGKAHELVNAARTQGWEAALQQANAQYGDELKNAPTDPNVLTLTNRVIQRVPEDQLNTMSLMTQDNPFLVNYLARARSETDLGDTLYQLVDPDQTEADHLFEVVESQSSHSVYCVKSVTIKRLSLQEYDKIKTMAMLQELQTDSQSLAPVHFNPDNILARMGFQLIKDNSESTTSANETDE